MKRSCSHFIWQWLFLATWLVVSINGLLIKSPAILEAAEPLQGTNPSLRDATDLGTPIPKEFKVEIIRQERTFNVLNFYLNAIHMIWWESIFPFFGSSEGDEGQFKKPPRISVTPSQAIYPHLLHCHIVWSLVKIAEDCFLTHDYREIKTNIMFKLRSGWSELGTLLVEEEQPKVLVSDQSPGSSPSEEARPGASNTSSTGNDDKMDIQTGFIRNGKKLQSTNVFLAVIRAIAALAEEDSNAEISAWQFVDSTTNVRIKMGATEGVSLEMTVGNVAEGLKYIVQDMVTTKRFFEMIAVYSMANPKKVEYGSLMILKGEAATVEVS